MTDEEVQDQDLTQDLQDLHKEYETMVASLTACIKGLKTLRKTATAATVATATDVRVRKGGVSKSLNRVLDKAEVDAIAAGTSYGTAVLEALEGAEIVDAE
jgi:hypothetical protein